MRKSRRISVLVLFIVPLFMSPLTYAQVTSPNYKADEIQFGTGGDVSVNSTSYQAGVGVGSLGVGLTTSANYRAEAGFVTANQPFLEMAISGPAVDFGTLSSGTTSYGDSKGGTCNCTFYVRSYLSGQYVVATMSQPPTSESNRVFTAKSVLAAPSGSTTVEEFGINLVANTVPASIGANIANFPDNTFADGTAATGYSTANQYKYGVGDTIARSALTSTNPAIGQTNYTISYIIKSKNTTAAGTYVMNHDIVVTSTY